MDYKTDPGDGTPGRCTVAPPTESGTPLGTGDRDALEVWVVLDGQPLSERRVAFSLTESAPAW